MKIVKIIIVIIVLCTSIVFYSKYVGTSGLETREYRVESNVLTSNFSGIKVIHFSDLLYGSTTDLKDLTNMVEKMNILEPDLILFTGDLISNKHKLTEDDKKKIIENLSKLEASIGKYAIYGDFDFDLNSYESIITSSGFKLLTNEYEEVFYKTNESMYIVGLPSSIKNKIDMTKSFEFYSDENRKYTIVMLHEGKTIKYIDESTYEVDLILGGHSLNGKIRLPFIGGLFKDEASYKYYDESYERGITKIYISGGMGTLDYDFRLNNKPSFNLYRLKAQS
ncbi:MAG: metallophosphoesterase [Bacilli bacterium]|nr:metallophosphoesterase [Bacilli bacterium]